MSDKIHPDHYRSGGMQVVDAIELFLSDDVHLSHAFKYMARAGKKPGSPYLEDLRKAQWWIERAIDFTERKAAAQREEPTDEALGS